MAIEAIELSLDLDVKGREEMTLREFRSRFRIPPWHPCPCSEGDVGRLLDDAYLNRLLDSRQRRALLPVIVIGNYVLTSTCLYRAVASMEHPALDRVRVMVWSLGDYDESERFAVMALAAELCHVHEDRDDREIKLDFARELIKNYVIDHAINSPAEALKLIDELGRGFHTTELAKVFSKYIRANIRTGENYIRALILNNDFINELRNIVEKLLSNNGGNIGSNAVHDESNRERFRRDFVSSPENVDRENVEQGSANNLNDEITKRLRVLKISGLLRGGDVNSTDLRALFRLSLRDLEVLARRLQGMPADSGLGLVKRVIALINEGRLGDAKVLIYTGDVRFSDSVVGNVASDEANSEAGVGDSPEAGPGVLFRRYFEFTCDDDTCPVIRELSNASRDWRVDSMARASIMLAARLASKAGSDALSEALNSLANYLGDAGLAEALLGLVRAYERDRAIVKPLIKLLSGGEVLGALRLISNDVEAMLNAVRESSANAVCETLQYVVADLVNLIPSNLRGSVEVRVNCWQ